MAANTDAKELAQIYLDYPLRIPVDTEGVAEAVFSQIVYGESFYVYEKPC